MPAKTSAEIVNEWFQEKCRGGALARDTEAYNQVFSAKADLISRLDQNAAPPASTKAKAPTE